MTISEIAKLAGVSTAAVSRYFNDGYISDQKREKIRKVVEETGYKPSVQAQMLRTKKTKTIVILVPRINSVSGTDVISGAKQVLEQKGYRMLLSSYDLDLKKELEYLKYFDETMADGIILLASIYSPALKKVILALPVPVVVIGQNIPGCYCVYHDDYHAMCDMVNFVLKKGRQHPAYFGVDKQDKAVGEQRTKAFEKTTAKAGFTFCKDRILLKGFGIEEGYESAKEIMERCPDTDAIICATDKIAMGVIQYLRQQGIHVPERVMVTGQGNTIISQVSYPSITTLKYYYEDSGIKGASMLLERIEQINLNLMEIKLGYELLPRESTGDC